MADLFLGRPRSHRYCLPQIQHSAGHPLNTAQYYQWLKQSEEATLESFQNGKKEKASRREEKLRQKLERMKSVVVEITMENLDLKKTLGS